jgi:hypothetical protein
MNARITCGLIATDASRVAALLAAILTVGAAVSAKAADISEYIVTDEAESIIADDQGRSPAKSPAPADRPRRLKERAMAPILLGPWNRI